MSAGHLTQMLDFLTSAYSREDVRNSRHSLPLETNIGKLFGTLAWGLELIHDSGDRMVLWDNLDNAQGAVLDRYGANFGVERGGTNDTFFRLLIKIKMIALLSGGDIDTIVSAAANLFDVEPSEVELREVFPAKVWLYIDEDILDAERLEAAPLIAELVKRIAAAGVGTRIFLRVRHKFTHRLYLGVAAVDEMGLTANVRTNMNRSGAVPIRVGMTLWEDIQITGNIRRN